MARLVRYLSSSSRGPRRRVCRAAIVGTPNAGKSVLVNRIVEAKISAVSPKRHTTRDEILGILTDDDTQLVLLDTPGVVARREMRQRESKLVRSPWEALSGVDTCVVVLDAAKQLYEAENEMLDRIAEVRRENPDFPVYLALNKTDRVKPLHKLFETAESLHNKIDFKWTHYISALNGDGVEDLVLDLLGEARPGEWPYPPETRVDMPVRARIEQAVREKLFVNFQQEVPYAVELELESMTQAPGDGGFAIRQTIKVPSESHRRILRGKSGRRLVELEKQCAEELRNILAAPTTIKLHVSVKKNDFMFEED